MSLNSLLAEKKCFKLICGAGNENLDEIEKLVAIFSKAGCYFFDFAADKKVLEAAQRGLDYSIPRMEQDKYYFCISVATSGDSHIQKARINRDNCKNCFECAERCPQNAIIDGQVVAEKCVGCMKCKSVCTFDAIECYFNFKNIDVDLFKNVDCVELHIGDENEDEVDELFDYVCQNFDGLKSLCLGRKKLSNEKIQSRIERLYAKNNNIMIQADGNPISGSKDDFQSTIQAVSMAEFVGNLGLDVEVLISGGVNTKSFALAHLCGVNINGIAMGSFARKYVKNYTEKVDFWDNKEILEEAVNCARELIKKSV